MIFTPEIKDAAQLWEGTAEVEIFLDRKAFADLLQQLSLLKHPGDHAHFMTPSGGGQELTEQAQREGNTIVHHLRLSLVEAEPRDDG